MPRAITVRDAGGGLLRQRSSEIDCATGTAKNVTTTLNDRESATTTLTYSSLGQLMGVVAPSGGGRTYELGFGYDEFVGAHVTSVTDVSFGFTSTAAVDPRLGLQTGETDIHGQSVTMTYDAFGRPTSVTGPYEQGDGVVTIAYDYHPTGPTPWAHTANYDELVPTDPIETYTFADGLGRVVQTKKDGTVFAGHETVGGSRVRVISGRIQYDPWGRTAKSWHPTTEALTAPGGMFVEPNPTGMVVPTRVTFDEQDRMVSTTLPDGAVTTQSYAVDGAGFAALLRTEVVDAEGKRRAALHDARGLIREVREFVGAGEALEVHSTTYDYNAMSELVSVLDAAGNATTVAYDLAGRRTEIDSPDAGRTALVYDVGGNVVRRETAALRARGQAIEYVYDRTHLVRVDHPGTEADVVYEWGNAAGAPLQRGRITRILDAGGTLERKYGPLGEVVEEVRHLYDHTQTPPTLTQLHPADAPTDAAVTNPEGPRLTTRYRYDTWGRLHELVYPDGEVVRYGYDSGGLVRSATGVKLGVTYPYVSRLEYDEFGQRVFQELGNGIRSSYTYDEETRRLATLGSGEFQRLEYGYDRVGNVTSLVNDVGPVAAGEHGGRVEQSFGYDDLHRLVSANGEWHEPGGARNEYTLSLGYDAIHNLTHKTQEHTVRRNEGGHGVLQRQTSYDFDYAYDGPQPHAPSHVGDRSFGYDASGRQVTVTPDQGGPRRTVLWDSEDRIRAIQDGGAAVLDEDGDVVAGHGRTTTLTYDHTGQRITKSGAQGHTAYVNPFYTLRNETVATKHVFVGATRITSKLVPGTSAEQLPTETDDVSRYLGRWWQHRSEEGWEHAQNTEMNPHYQVPTQMPSPMGLPESNFVYFYHPDHLGSTSFVTDGGGEIYEQVQYFPHGEVWADERSNTERLPYLFTGKEMDQETGLYDFGARMYDAREGLWLSADPAIPQYLLGEGGVPLFSADSGEEAEGVFNPMHLSAYAYANQNSVLYRDPTGRSTVVDAEGNVRQVIDDDDLGIYLGVRSEYTRVGETRFWDAFLSPDTGRPVGRVYFGQSIDAHVDAELAAARGMSMTEVFTETAPNGRFDIKSNYPGHENRSYHGFLFRGKYMTLREIGNYMAGYNAATHGMDYDEFQQGAGALHVAGVPGLIAWLAQDPPRIPLGLPPRYGENEYQYTRSRLGYRHGEQAMQRRRRGSR